MKRFRFVLLALAVVYGCASDFSEEQLSAFDTPMMVRNGKEILRYDEKACQLAFNRERGEFRIMKDNLSDYVCVRLSTLSLRAGEEIKGTIIWSEPEDLCEKNDITLKVLKLEDDMIWLKSDREHIGLVLKALE